MTLGTLESIYGPSVRPKDLARFLGLDTRTVIKYAQKWGGVEVAPGTYRFFEKRIMEVIDAEFDCEKRPEKIPGKRYGRRCSSTEIVSGRYQEVFSGSGGLGKRNTAGSGKRKIRDSHGIFNDERLDGGLP
jgi:hypothetical protein